MTACAAKLGLCRCERSEVHTMFGPSAEHRCHCGCTWQTGDAGVQFGTTPVQPAVRS